MKTHILFILSILLAFPAASQNKRVYLNPGHGSWGPDDRPMPTIPYPMLSTTGRPDTCGFYESNTNLWKALECGARLKKNGHFTVKFSRVKNGPYPYRKGASNEFRYNRSLSEISAEVDTWGADMFLSIHSNAASEGSLINYPLFLYRGYDSQESAAGSKAMAQAIWPRLTEAMHAGFEVMTYYKTSTNIRGDIDFYHSSWTNDRGITGYLGVLHHLTPGFLSEGYFHTYQPARHRALNQDWCRQEGIRYYRGIIDYFGVNDEKLGCIMGQLHDRIQKSSSLEYFNACPDTPDEYLPANGVLVRLKNSDGEVVSTYVTDQNYNGIFVFNDLEPGRYFIEMKADGYVTRKGRVNSTTVKADATAYKTIEMFRGNSTPFDDEVGIEIPASTPREESCDAVYDLSGRRLPDGQLPRGIYIRNGKRVIIE
ncbi:MAG: N-acetylmuramoyl-L-alanine amidase [Bacteroidaceae bacterium]|nr:N-acetylmuramoyl-L-alanine amidase [Bacteroidaceae bacterium]